MVSNVRFTFVVEQQITQMGPVAVVECCNLVTSKNAV